LLAEVYATTLAGSAELWRQRAALLLASLEAELGIDKHSSGESGGDIDTGGTLQQDGRGLRSYVVARGMDGHDEHCSMTFDQVSTAP
jgi:hypothetical protein